MIPCIYPYVTGNPAVLRDGASVAACKFCKSAINSKSECQKHYESLRSRPEGFYACPFGFTTRTFYFNAEFYAITGLIGFPRFNSAIERSRAKEKDSAPLKIARESIEAARNVFTLIESLATGFRVAAQNELPQALHDLRKLNAVVKQGSEILEERYPNEEIARNVHSASELMSNSFDVVEALANVDGLAALPFKEHIALRDLAYKTKKIYLMKAKERDITSIIVSGDDLGVVGNKKLLPIVCSVLLENAIKYAKKGTGIELRTSRLSHYGRLEVSNFSDHPIDPIGCFSRGTRFAPAVEGSGLGLFLASEIVKVHRGTLSCHLSAGKVLMRFDIPLYKNS